MYSIGFKPSGTRPGIETCLPGNIPNEKRGSKHPRTARRKRFSRDKISTAQVEGGVPKKEGVAGGFLTRERKKEAKAGSSVGSTDY